MTPITPNTIIIIGRYKELVSMLLPHKLNEYPVTFTNGINTDTIINADAKAPKILKINLSFILPLLSYYIIISFIRKNTT